MAQPEFTTDEIETEEWRVIPDPRFDLYEVSNLGRVRRPYRSKRLRGGYYLLSQKLLYTGYWGIELFKRGKGVEVSVHQLVALAFIGPCPAGKQINHIDYCRANERASNLEYLTPQENCEYSKCNLARGEKNGWAKLTDKKVRTIRREFASGNTRTEIALRYSVSNNTIERIINGVTWRHV